MKLLAFFLRLLADWIDPVAETPSTSLTVGASLPGEQFAQALASLFKLADTVFATVNTPEMIAARKSSDVQAILNKWDADLKAAQAGGSIAQIDKESSG